MAKKLDPKTIRKHRKEDDLAEPKVHFWQAMEPRTIRGIGGVLLFVLALILLLSALGMAGLVGQKIFYGLYMLVGVGYYLLPVLLLSWAWSLWRTGILEQTLRPIRATGAVLFFISSLALVGVLSSDRAGLLGTLIARPLLHYLESIATIVVLAGLLIVSFLLLFDTELWVMLWRNARKLFSSKASAEDADSTGDVSIEELNARELADIRAAAAEETTEPTPLPVQEDEDDGPNTVEELEGPLGVEDPSGTPIKKERDVYVPPSPYVPPPVSLLEHDRGKAVVNDTKSRANIIRKTFQHFKIPVEMDEITVGPSVTQYALKPAANVKLEKIRNLQANLELALAATSIRIEAPIPGRSLVGIEVPNQNVATVGLAGLVSNPEFTDDPSPLLIALGKDITGSHHYADIGKMPHLLIAGTTGSGKSVMIHSIVTSLLYRNSPERMRLILVDPKRVELTLYDNIPHLMTPVITDAKKCILSLKWAAKEMERRYDILRKHKVQSLAGYHSDVLTPAHAKYERLQEKGEDVTDFPMPEALPHIVIIIDELAEIMATYPRELEAAIVRLAQLARAVGIHLVLATQRPEAKVITGLIKANIPTRIAFKVNTLIDSRVILDQAGAEKLVGKGDMLFLGGDMPKPRRLQSPFVTTGEVRKVTDFLRKHNDYMLMESIDLGGGNGDGGSMGGNSAGGIDMDEMEDSDDLDGLYEDVRAYVVMEQKASTSLIQRRFRVGYGRAARIMDQLEAHGVIEKSDGTNRPRKVCEGGGTSDGGYDSEHDDESERY